MKKFLNKLSSSGNLKEETQFTGEEHIDTHVRKQTTLPSEPKDTPEEFKMKKSFSLSKATSPRFKEAVVESDDFSKKKSSSNGLKKEKTKDKLNESDDKLVRKSKSMKNPSSLRSPSLKSIFTSYEHQKDAKDGMMNQSSDSEEEDAFVPHHHADLRDENENEFNSFSTPIRVPSAPARLATSPSFSSSSPSPSPSPTMVSLHTRAASPSPSYVSSPGKRTPPLNSSSPPSFTKMPPSHALAPTPSSPHVIVADEFDTTFGTRQSSEGFGTPIKYIDSDFRSEGRLHVDTKIADEHVDGEEEVLHQKNKSGLFSFGSNKPMKLKA